MDTNRGGGGVDKSGIIWYNLVMSLNLQAPVSTLFNSSNSSGNTNSIPNASMNQNASSLSAQTANYASVGNNSIGGITGNLTTGNSFNVPIDGYQGGNYYGYYWPYWQPYNEYYHSCHNTFTTSDKFETAFKLARKLMDKKLVKPQKTVEDFFKLMDSIVEIL